MPSVHRMLRGAALACRHLARTVRNNELGEVVKSTLTNVIGIHGSPDGTLRFLTPVLWKLRRSYAGKGVPGRGKVRELKSERLRLDLSMKAGTFKLCRKCLLALVNPKPKSGGGPVCLGAVWRVRFVSPVKPVTVNMYVAAVKSFLGFAHRSASPASMPRPSSS